MPDSEIAGQLHRSLRLLTLATIILYIITMIVAGFAVIDSRDKTAAIQRERRTSTLNNCLDQNARNKSTIGVIDAQIALLPVKQQAGAKASRAYIVLLINALAPHQDCYKLVARNVKS